ncbi:7-carboxy-7-deazaguanine synthase QueE, partial [Neisseria gonorrhoeae]|nr:7-carboxy-7-deazaguanine synthase QueE [Neisseria gonorrhoeae]
HLDMLLDTLKAEGYFLCIETNGLNPVPPQIDYVATSPKACYAAKYEKSCIETADEVRIVADGDVVGFCENMERKIRAHHYYLSPCEQDGAMNIYDTIRQIGILNSRPDAPVHWQLSVQTH